MKLAVEIQAGPVEDETRARVAMVRPILRATLFALSMERIERLGGYAAITLQDLAREWREGDGDCGICFEYAIHDAIEGRAPNPVPPEQAVAVMKVIEQVLQRSQWAPTERASGPRTSL